MDVSGQTVCTGHFIAREKALVFTELGVGWVLDLVWMFWRRDSSVAPAKIWTPDLPVYILVIVLIMLPHNDLKVMQKAVLIKWDGRFGLDVFYSWHEFLEDFSEHGNTAWSSVKWNCV